MKRAIIVTDSKSLSQALARFLTYVFDYQCQYFTYSNSSLISQASFREADFYVMGLLREHNDGRIRAEAIIATEKIDKSGKNVLIISGEVLGDKIDSSIYWDSKSKLNLKETIIKLLSSEKIDYVNELNILKQYFSNSLYSLVHHHSKR